MKNFIFLFCLFCSTIVFAQDQPIGVPQIGIRIQLGTTVSIQGLSINFSEVIEDSRCPKGVNCVWAGRAKVKIEVFDEITLDHQFLTFGENSENIIFRLDGYQVKAVSLTPYPSANDRGERDYVLIVVKQRITD